MDVTPFKSAALEALARSLVCPEIYHNPFPSNNNNTIDVDRYGKKKNFKKKKVTKQNKKQKKKVKKIIYATPLMEYILVPLSKRGLNSSSILSNGTSAIDTTTNSTNTTTSSTLPSTTSQSEAAEISPSLLPSLSLALKPKPKPKTKTTTKIKATIIKITITITI